MMCSQRGLCPCVSCPRSPKPTSKPELLAFRPRTAWSLHNAFTGLAKEMPMPTRLPAIQAVGKLFGMSADKPRHVVLLMVPVPRAVEGSGIEPPIPADPLVIETEAVEIRED